MLCETVVKNHRLSLSVSRWVANELCIPWTVLQRTETDRRARLEILPGADNASVQHISLTLKPAYRHLSPADFDHAYDGRIQKRNADRPSAITSASC